ncbi:MetQ/NlpA family ABC transporter substrate-binding protein [Campylobacter sp. LR286c]|uniref:MetQ/NlpA family ABC transporter substrate-binding protein n=1 Tax=Campylobacter sp. LR286c TaxID=2593545 RepID=UPI00398A173B
MMKKIFLFLSLLSFIFASDKTIVIGATPTPHAEILKFSKPLFEARGYKLEVKEFNDYLIPNFALNDKDLDANFYQHKPFLDDFNKNKNTNLVPIEHILLVPMAVYSNKFKDIANIKNGASIAIPNDPTNESRALDLLEKANLIKLENKENKTPLDIKENPKKLKFIELKAAQLPRALGDADLAVIPTNYALGAGLNPLKDGLIIESKDSPYAIVIAVRKGDEDKEKSKILKDVLRSKEIKEYIEKTYQGSVIPTF